ncbi:HD family hydrolase [Orbus mooreae]|uniref:HD family hydrolase n=1 Tax=Orbus mooreae TaxID=3074107 RepID=UPI00370D8C71
MTWLTTYSGSHFDYSKPSIESINITDIAKALSHECRFAGQLERFYSVAQHCVECSHIVPAKFALEALLHDAVEAYCKDIPSPLKKLLPDYQQMEKSVDLVVRQKFNLPLIESLEVKKADLIMLATEHRDLANDGKDWPILNGIPLLQRKIEPQPSNIAFNRFIRRYEELTNVE